MTAFVEARILRCLPAIDKEFELPSWVEDVELGGFLYFLNFAMRSLVRTFELPEPWQMIGSEKLVEDVRVVDIAMSFLSDWPHGLHAILRGDSNLSPHTKRDRWTILAEGFNRCSDVHMAIHRAGFPLNRVMQDGTSSFLTHMTPAQKRAIGGGTQSVTRLLNQLRSASLSFEGAL